MKLPKAELSWTLAQWQESGQEPPERLLVKPEACEGLLMSDDEIDEYIADALRTLMVLRDKGSDRFDEVYAYFEADMVFLVKLGRLTSGVYDEIMRPENFEL